MQIDIVTISVYMLDVCVRYRVKEINVVYRSNPWCGAFVAGMLVGGMWAGASAAEKQSAGGISARSATTFFTFSGNPKVSISNHGNIVQFEAPPGFEHIGIGAFSEGYVLCYG